MKEKKDASGFDRRTFLKTTANTGLATSGLVFGVSGVQASRGAYVNRLTGTAEDPIALDDIRAERDRLIDTFDRHGGSFGDHLAYGEPEPVGDTDIVDYVVRILPNGNPSQFVAAAGEGESVANAHARADSKESAFKHAAGSNSFTTDSVSTQSGCSDTTDWNCVTYDSDYNEESPYGQTTHNYDWYRIPEDIDKSGHDMHAVHTKMAMTPGSVLWNNNWHNQFGFAEHRWWKGDFSGYELHDWDPSSTTDSNVSVTLSASTTPLSWTFDNNVSIDMFLDSAEPNIKWELNSIWNENRWKTIGQEPGSACEVDEPPCGERTHLVNTYARGQYEDADTSKYYLGFNWDLYWTTYC